MQAIFHQFTPAELYIGISVPKDTVPDNATESPVAGFHPTGCAFFDLFLGNLHQYGMHNSGYHAAKLGVTKTGFYFTLQTLTGMTFTDFSTAYILLMVNDLMKDKKTDLKVIAHRLGFGSYSGFYRFMIRNKKEKPSWL